jgi:predicted DNA-binding transcriptional regulator AlpA
MDDDDDLIDIQELRRLVGGNRLPDASTIYRHVQKGILPKPIRIGGSSRWVRRECKDALRRLMEGRP